MLAIIVFLSSSANAAPEFEGRGGEDVATEMSKLLTHAYLASRSCLDLKLLCIRPAHYSWLLYIDVVVSRRFIVCSFATMIVPILTSVLSSVDRY